MLIQRLKLFGNRENKAKRKAWEEKQGLEAYQKKVANNGLDMAQNWNPVNKDLYRRKTELEKGLKEGSKEAKAELRAIHRNKFDYNDISRNVDPKIMDKYTDKSIGSGNRGTDFIKAKVEGGEDAYQRIMERRNTARKNKKLQRRGVKKNQPLNPLPKPPVVNSIPKSTISEVQKKKSVLGGLGRRIGQGLRKIAFR